MFLLKKNKNCTPKWHYNFLSTFSTAFTYTYKGKSNDKGLLMHFPPLNRKVVGSWLLEVVDGRLMYGCKWWWGKNGGRKRLGEIAVTKTQNYVEEKGESEVKCFWSSGDGGSVFWPFLSAG